VRHLQDAVDPTNANSRLGTWQTYLTNEINKILAPFLVNLFLTCS